MRKTALMLPVLMILSACGTSGQGDAGCLIFGPIWFHPDDRLTERTTRAIIRHNETWEMVCG
jgi:predicted small lipoprotein YifL